MTRIAVIVGHPDPAPGRFVRALAAAYTQGATQAGHEVRAIDVAGLDFPLLRSRSDWESGPAPEGLAEARATIQWAEHLVLVYPLWLGDVPALLKAFLEQVMRPGFAFRYRDGAMPEKMLKGKSARLVVTMGMPGFVYRWFYRAHSLKSLERNVFSFVGVSPVRHTVIGMVESKHAGTWLERLRELGRHAG